MQTIHFLPIGDLHLSGYRAARRPSAADCMMPAKRVAADPFALHSLLIQAAEAIRDNLPDFDSGGRDHSIRLVRRIGDATGTHIDVPEH